MDFGTKFMVWWCLAEEELAAANASNEEGGEEETNEEGKGSIVAVFCFWQVDRDGILYIYF